MKKDTEIERGTAEESEKQDERKKMKTDSEKIVEKMQIPLVLLTFFVVAEDRSVEISLNADGNNRKTRLLLPRDPFPIPTVSMNVRVTTKRLTHESDGHNQFVFHIVITNTIKEHNCALEGPVV